ncbi:MAG: 2-hydroxyacid dehydrogenase [Candidatus Caldarchaeum sp.]
MTERVVYSYVSLDRDAVSDLSKFAKVYTPESLEAEEVKPKAEVIICISIKPEEFQKLRSLKFIQVLSAGVDGLPWPHVPPHVMVAGNMGSNADAVAEHTWAILLSIAKKTCHYFQKVQGGDFKRDVQLRLLSGKTLAVIGMGSIGAKVAEVGKVFSMRVIGVTKSGKARTNVDEIFDAGKLGEVLPQADVLVISTPLTKHTKGMFRFENLRLLKKGCIVVNVGRAEVVDRDGLLRFLRERPDVVFATDVWWEVKPEGSWETELNKLPNFFGTPWIAGAFGTPEVYNRMVKAAINNVIKYLNGQKPDNIIDRTEYV